MISYDSLTNPGPYRAVLLDIDGTLIDTADLIADSLEHTCRVHLGKTHPRTDYYSLIGRPALVQMKLLGGEVRANAMLDTAIEFYESHQEQERAFTGALDLLAQLREVGIRLAFVTSKLRRELDPTLQRIPLHRYTSVIVTSEMTTRPKPFPDPVYLALQTLEIGAAETLFVGDSPYDLQSGAAAGVHTGAATWGPHPASRLEAENPTYMLRSFSELLRICRPRT